MCIMIRIVLNRREVSGLRSCNFTRFVSPLSNKDKDKGQRRGTLYNSAPTVGSHTIKIQRNLIFRMHYELAESKDSGDLIILKMTINEEGSLSAMGLFPVDKSTICTIISTVVTYLLILVQHKD